MYVFRKVTGNVYVRKKVCFIFRTLYNLHKLKMAGKKLKTNYYNFSVHTSQHAFTISVGSDT